MKISKFQMKMDGSISASIIDRDLVHWELGLYIKSPIRRSKVDLFSSERIFSPFLDCKESARFQFSKKNFFIEKYTTFERFL